MTSRLHLRWVWRDLWVGVYVAPEHVYVCPLPTVVLIWDRGEGR